MKRMTKKQEQEMAARDAKARRLDKLGIGNSHFGVVYPDTGEPFRSKIQMPYPYGFITDQGHWILTAWGFQGRSLCGKTITFDDDHISQPQNTKREMLGCCNMRLARMQCRLGYRKLIRATDRWCWYVPTERLTNHATR